MNKNNTKVRNIILLVLAVFFGLQFLSRFVSSLGSRTGTPGLYKAGYLCFPFEAEPLYRYGKTILKESSAGDAEKDGVEKGLIYLEKSRFINPFDYRTHFDLGNAYLSRLPLSDDFFKKGIESLKRSVRLGGGKNVDISNRTLRLMISHWGRLSDKDKVLCRKLLKNVIKKISGEDFETLLVRWEQYSRDVTLFEGALETAPRYYNVVAAALSRLEITPELRRLFKLNHEIYTLEDVKEQYKKLSNRSPGLISRLIELRLRLKQNITGYYQLVTNSKFKRQSYRELLTRLNFHILSRFFLSAGWQDLPRQREEVENFLLSGIDDFPSSNDLEELYRFLDKKKFFSSRSIRSNYIKGLILFKKRDYAAVIAHLERARYDVSAEYGTGGEEYPRILLLLSDAYISSRLLTKALTVLSEIDARSSRSVLMDMYRQKVKIAYITGPDAVENGQQSKYYDLLYKSRSITLLDLSSETEVYLVNGAVGTGNGDNIIRLGIDEIEIRPGLPLKEKIKDRHLLQVFIDGNIRHEVYLSQLDFEKPINLKISSVERFSKHSIHVIII